MAQHKQPLRTRQIAAIHVGCKTLGLDEAQRRAMYRDVAGADSAANLDVRGRRAVLAHLKRLGFDGAGRRAQPPAAIDSADCGPMIAKIEAQLAEAKRPWVYADAMAKRMFGIDRVALCAPEHLHKLIAALAIDARRHGRRI